MNACIEMLNRWGENFLNFAWLMLWQSSLLIAVVFAFDILLAKRIRASVRYALWMVVLVKLLLPPALALPTGATWWLWRPTPVVETPIVKNYTVTYDNTAPLEDFVPQTIPIQLPPPQLDGSAWTMIAFAATGTGLLLLLAFRWTRVARKVRRAMGSDAFAEILEETRQLAGLRRPIRLKLINDTLSPAVYGLFRPVILLPLALMDKLSTQQLRAVLLHEAIHLRRGDVWVNCAQTLLQIAYWWHPLLWLANVRIRRLREEAVDDAVMAALRDGADAYAPTLLEVAKFAFRRPLASLGLIGIMESRSALRQRIERLVDFRPPRKAGITFLSLCGVFVFSAVALPMGEGPAQEEKQITSSTIPEVATNAADQNLVVMAFRLEKPISEEDLKKLLSEAGVKFPPTILACLNNGSLLARGTAGQLALIERVIMKINGYSPRNVEVIAKEISRENQTTATNLPHFEMRTFKLNPKTFYPNLQGLIPFQPLSKLTNANMIPYDAVGKDGGLYYDPNPKQIRDVSSLAKQFFSALNVNLNPPKSVFFNDRLSVLFVYATPQDLKVIEKAVQILNDTSAPVHIKNVKEVRVAGAPASLNEENPKPVIQVSTNQTRNVIYKKLNSIRIDTVSYQSLPLDEVLRTLHKQSRLHDPDKGGINFLFNPNPPQSTINPATGLPEVVAAGAQPVDASQINITLNLKNAGLADLLNAICLVADHPIKYSVEEYGVVFSNKTDASPCEMRTFKVDSKTFYSNLQKAFHSLLPSVYEKDIQSTTVNVEPQNGYVPDRNMMRISGLVGHFFSAFNVNLSPPETVFFNDRLGVLFVYATPQHMNDIERIVCVLNSTNVTLPIMKRTLSHVSKSPAPADLNNVISAPLAAKLPVNTSVSIHTVPTNLVTTTFRVDYHDFATVVRKKTGIEEPLEGFKQLAAEAGVDFSPPNSVSLEQRDLFITLTMKDLNAIKPILDDLHCYAQMIHIKARFIEAPQSFFASLPPGMTNGTGILSNPEFQVVLHEIQQEKGTEEWAEPEATTISSRQTEMRATTIQPIFTGYTFGEASAIPAGFPDNYIKRFSDGSAIVPQIQKVETGPILDVVPMVLPGDYKIDLQTTASLIAFLGYEDSKNAKPHYATNSMGEQVTLPAALPKFAVKQAKFRATLNDGQTLVLFPKLEQAVSAAQNDKSLKMEKQSENRTLIVLVTATLIDPAGNRIHSDNEMRILENTNYIDTVPISANVP